VRSETVSEPITPCLIYDLRLGGDCSDGFYVKAERFTDRLLAEMEARAGTVIDDYSHYVQEELREAERSHSEYALDLLMLGMALRQYAGAAQSTSSWVVALAQELYWVRRDARWMKPLADLGRAAIWRYCLASKIGRTPKAGPYSLKRLPRLIEWLQATGEFEQETRRLNNWHDFLRTLLPAEADRWMEVSVDLFDWFERAADEALGSYTRGVEGFLTGEFARRGVREDQIFCSRPQVEYHLAMVATEIMNRGLREQFEQTTHRAVLAPACMRGEHASSCKAHEFGADITCTGCNPHCTVNRITREMRERGARVYLVPHSTGFSSWLERWQHEPNTGVVAVACLLNILPGGYEMRARRIPSQCVPLDYPGCQKHWTQKGISTGANEGRLARIVAGPAKP
jgi:hypothetical protein